MSSSKSKELNYKRNTCNLQEDTFRVWSGFVDFAVHKDRADLSKKQEDKLLVGGIEKTWIEKTWSSGKCLSLVLSKKLSLTVANIFVIPKNKKSVYRLLRSLWFSPSNQN